MTPANISPAHPTGSWVAVWVFMGQCSKQHYKASPPLCPFLFLDTDGKDQQEGLALWVPRILTLSQIKPNTDCSDGCSLDSSYGAGLATSVSLPESFRLAQALFSRLFSTDCFDFCDYVMVMCSQCTNMFTT